MELKDEIKEEINYQSTIAKVQVFTSISIVILLVELLFESGGIVLEFYSFCNSESRTTNKCWRVALNNEWLPAVVIPVVVEISWPNLWINNSREYAHTKRPLYLEAVYMTVIL